MRVPGWSISQGAILANSINLFFITDALIETTSAAVSYPASQSTSMNVGRLLFLSKSDCSSFLVLILRVFLIPAPLAICNKSVDFEV